ncbi:glutaredoxin [Glutamicibacter halophytocola]|uniref:glutaredoxin family protein n=1 Tax=Glutamicibacter halophytocola TaxID=1933880 RepID=UPI0006D4A3FA|nr:glutaredoxin family protein [Glutamicibacter halophytocola]ALG28047.1 glutaredoxin [Glutamicibacter halophytocola]
MTAIAVYSKPSCVQCTQTMRKLDQLGLEYTKIDITQDAGAYKYVTQTLGYQAAPVVVTEDSHWYGYRPDLINELAVN